MQHDAGTNDYARKQWAGLVKDYYAPRVGTYLAQALADEKAGAAINMAALNRRLAKLALEWQTNFGNGYALIPEGDPVSISESLRAKYASHFRSCSHLA